MVMFSRCVTLRSIVRPLIPNTTPHTHTTHTHTRYASVIYCYNKEQMEIANKVKQEVQVIEFESSESVNFLSSVEIEIEIEIEIIVDMLTCHI